MNNKIFNQINNNLEEYFDIYKKNMIFNLSNGYQDISEVSNIIKNKKVYIVGASPSLDKVMDRLIQAYRNSNTIIIAVDMAYRALHKIVKPDIVITCEIKRVNYFTGIDVKNTILFAFSGSNYQNIRDWKGRIFFYNWIVNDVKWEKLFKEYAPALSSLATGVTVFSQAAVLSIVFGAKNIFFVGNDMAFRNRFYSRGTIREKEDFCRTNKFYTLDNNEYMKIKRNKAFKIIRNDNIYFTNRQMYASKLWLEKMVALYKQRVNFIDLSEVGITRNLIKGI